MDPTDPVSPTGAAETGNKSTKQEKPRAKPERTTAKKKQKKPKPTPQSRHKAARAPSKRSPRAFPIVGLETAISIAQKIKEINQGNPWDSNDVAKATLGTNKNNNKFFYAATASRDYGLTIGGRDSDKVTLQELGRQLVYAPNKEAQDACKLQAFFNVDLFKRVFSFYKGNNLPKEREFLSNTLESEFDIHPDYHDDFIKVFTENCSYLGFEPGVAVDNPDVQVGDAAPTTEVVGKPKGKTTVKAFVAMPFSEKSGRPTGFFSEVLASLLIPAGVEAGFTVETARREGSDVIHSTIINDLIGADLVIADLTDHNPNVLFELGVRMALDKPVALIKAKGTGQIFDVDGTLRVKEYDPNLWPSTVQADIPGLAAHFKAAWENRNSDTTYMKILRSKPKT